MIDFKWKGVALSKLSNVELEEARSKTGLIGAQIILEQQRRINARRTSEARRAD